ncbi:aldose 1-epimerase family protein [Phaeacidiphilus oryzae]|jgi:aldose 1-epimerase|uniref:aldose 1-epimerase family protein n=1 Tax=Phaeacidiphilus oryzae TaxID=348818 RepID=UPI00055C4131|nr:aldose 1-epimerase family protein [Phaeacidiphilus oryzae]
MAESQSPSPAPAPTGPQYTIESDGYQAVLTGVGAGLRSLTHRGRRLVLDYPEDRSPVGGAGQLLVPWPNRIRDGRYAFDGQQRQLDLSEPANHNAIHGLTRTQSWNAERVGDREVRFGYRLYPQHGYPHVLDLSVTYALGGHGLSVEVHARNAGSSAAPYGLGWHPYLTLGNEPVDGALLQVPASEWIRVDERMNPVGKPPTMSEPVDGTDYDFREARRIGSVQLDTAFTGLRREADGLLHVTLTDAAGDRGVRLWAGEGIDWLQLFTGDTLPQSHRRAGVAVEPMSCPPNAFADGVGVIRLAPGETAAHRWGIAAI